MHPVIRLKALQAMGLIAMQYQFLYNLPNLYTIFME